MTSFSSSSKRTTGPGQGFALPKPKVPLANIKHLMEFVPLCIPYGEAEEIDRAPINSMRNKLLCSAMQNSVASSGSFLDSNLVDPGDRGTLSPPNQTNLKFWNSTFDKGRLKNFVSWFLKNYGERKTIELLEQFKNLGFGYATQAGVSLGIDDLLIPPEKMKFLSSSNKTVYQSNSKYKNAKITAVEKIQLFIDTWNETSENLKKEVVRYFEKTNIFNPVYMMAFSGARGNISQVRQLVGMRGLMSDPQGNIIDFPIQSNFREGLTLTEYIISTYGARKGIVDTALRTATAGYLTRRLVDVAQHVMISLFDCKTNRGIFVFDMKEGNQTLSSFQSRLVGRVLANDMFVTDKGTLTCIGYRNQEISNELATKMAQLAKKAFVRSPLTCQSSKFVCQLCYGWSLSRNKLVSLGEAVGVIAGQSIGEPGTQLTMRTFHTGGVFSGGLTESVVANYDGWIEYLEPIPGTCIRTLQGKIAFLTKAESSFLLKQKNTSSKNSPNQSSGSGPASLAQSTNNLGFHKIPGYAILFARHKQVIFKKQILAQFSSGNQFKTQKGNAEQTVYADIEGEIFFNQIDLLEQKSNYFMQDTLWKSYYKSKIWILAGKIYQNKFHPLSLEQSFNSVASTESQKLESSGKSTNFLVKNKDFVNNKSVFERVSWQSPNQNIIEFSKVPSFLSMKKRNIFNSSSSYERKILNLETNSFGSSLNQQSKSDLHKIYLMNKFFLFNTLLESAPDKSFTKGEEKNSRSNLLSSYTASEFLASSPGGNFQPTGLGYFDSSSKSSTKTWYKFLLNYQKIKTKNFSTLSESLSLSQNLKLQIPSIYVYNRNFRSIFKNKYNVMDLSKNKLTQKSFLNYFNNMVKSEVNTYSSLEQNSEANFSNLQQTDRIEFNLQQIKQKNIKVLANYNNQERYIPNFFKRSPLKLLEKNPVWISRSFSYKRKSDFNSRIVKFSITKKNTFSRKFLWFDLLTKKCLTNKLNKTNSYASSSNSLVPGTQELLGIRDWALGTAFPQRGAQEPNSSKFNYRPEQDNLEKIFYIYETNFSNQLAMVNFTPSNPLASNAGKKEGRKIPLSSSFKGTAGSALSTDQVLSLPPLWGKSETLLPQRGGRGKLNYSKRLVPLTKFSKQNTRFQNLLIQGMQKNKFSIKKNLSLVVPNLPNHKLLKTPLLFVSLNKIVFRSMGYIFEISNSVSLPQKVQPNFLSSGKVISKAVPRLFLRKDKEEDTKLWFNHLGQRPETMIKSFNLGQQNQEVPGANSTKVLNVRKKFHLKENYKILSFFPLSENNFKKPYLKEVISPYNNENIKPNPTTVFHWFPEKEKMESGLFICFKSNKKLNFQTNFWIQKKRFRELNYMNNSSSFSFSGTGSSENLRKLKQIYSKKLSRYKKFSYGNIMPNDAEQITDFLGVPENSTSGTQEFNGQNFKKFSVSTEKFYWIPQQNYKFSSNFADLEFSGLFSTEKQIGRINSKNCYIVNRQGKKKQIQFEISGLTLVQENFVPNAKFNYSNKAFIGSTLESDSKKRKQVQQKTKFLKSKVFSSHFQNRFFLSSLLKKRNKQIFKNSKQSFKFKLNKKFNSFLLDSELKNLLLKNLKKKFLSLSWNFKKIPDNSKEYKVLSDLGKRSWQSNSMHYEGGSEDSLGKQSSDFSEFFTFVPYSKTKVFRQPNLLTKKSFQTSFSSSSLREPTDPGNKESQEFSGTPNPTDINCPYYLRTKNLNITVKPGWVYVFTKKNKIPVSSKEVFSLHQTFFKSGHNFIHDVNFEQHPVYIENCISKNFSSFSSSSFVRGISSGSIVPQEFFKENSKGTAGSGLGFFPSSPKGEEQPKPLVPGTIDAYEPSLGGSSDWSSTPDAKVKPLEFITANISLKKFSKKLKNQNCRYIVNKVMERSLTNLALLIRPIHSKILPNSYDSKTILIELNKNLNNIKSSYFLVKDYHSNLLNKQFCSQKTFLSGCYLDFQINKISPLLNLQKKPLWFHTNRLKTENQENKELDLESSLSLFEFLPRSSKTEEQILFENKDFFETKQKSLDSQPSDVFGLQSEPSTKTSMDMLPVQGAKSEQNQNFSSELIHGSGQSRSKLNHEARPENDLEDNPEVYSEQFLSYIDSASQKQKTLFKNTIKKNFVELNLKTDTLPKSLICSYETYYSYKPFYSNSFQSSWQLGTTQTGFQNFDSQAMPMVQISSKFVLGSGWAKPSPGTNESICSESGISKKFQQNSQTIFKNQNNKKVISFKESKLNKLKKLSGVDVLSKADSIDSENLVQGTFGTFRAKAQTKTSKKPFLVNNIYPLPFLKWFLTQKTAYLGNQRFDGIRSALSGANFHQTRNLKTKSTHLTNTNFQRQFSKNSFLFYRLNLVLKNQTFANTDILSPFQGEFIQSKRSKNSWWNKGSETFLIQKQEKMQHEIFLTKKDMFCVLFPKFNHSLALGTTQLKKIAEPPVKEFKTNFKTNSWFNFWFSSASVVRVLVQQAEPQAEPQDQLQNHEASKNNGFKSKFSNSSDVLPRRGGTNPYWISPGPIGSQLNGSYMDKFVPQTNLNNGTSGQAQPRKKFRKHRFRKSLELQFSLNLRPKNFKPVILHFNSFSRNSVYFKKFIMDHNEFDSMFTNVPSGNKPTPLTLFPHSLTGANGAGKYNTLHLYAPEDTKMEQTGFPKKQKSYASSLIKLSKKHIPLIRKAEFLDQFLSEAKEQTYKIDNFLTKYQKRLYKLKGLSVGKSNKFVNLRLGTFLFKGDLINSFTSFHKTGQILHINSKKITLRYAQPFLVSAKGILHVHQGDPVFKNVPVITLPFDTFTTGDIVQGIPKVEQYLEARTTQNGRFFIYSLPVLLQGIFKRYCNKFPLDQAVSQSFLKIQLIIVDGVQRVYRSQGVSIADKHLEVIVKQMTSKVQIVHGGQTGFFPGELVDLEIIERINPFLMVKIQYEPVVLGITRASLEVESFLSAASFQQTTKILAKSSLYKKKDFLKGLKENILIGNLIPAGTGYMNIL
jgi:hypothetical protein